MPFAGNEVICTYNGVEWDDTTEILSFRASPQYDKAGRTASHVVYSFQLRKVFVASGGQTTDDIMNDIWNSLLIPGQRLAFSGIGIGDFDINTGNVRDVLWGPKPQGLSYKAIGDGAMELVWGCEVALPACDSGAHYENAMMEFNYRLEYEIDRAGYTRRTYSGYLRIPQTRGNGRNLRDNADRYFDKVVPKLPVGYRVADRRRQLDESKCTLTFTIVHEQMGPNIPPPGVIDVHASHRIESNHLSLLQYQGVISAEYICDSATNPESCWPHFKQLCAERWAETSNRPFRKIGAVPKGLLIDPIDFALPMNITMEEPGIYDVPRVARFSVTYLMFAHVAELIKSAGLFRLVDKRDWNIWAASLSQTGHHARGADKLQFEDGDDAIVDLCLSGGRQAPIPRPEGTQQRRFLDFSDVFNSDCPPPLKSFLSYRNKLEFKTRDNVIEHKPLPKPDDGELLPAERSFIGKPLYLGDPEQGAEVPPKPKAVEKSTFHRRTENQNEVFLVGSALRACYDIPPPKLKKIGKNDLVQANRPEHGEGFSTWVVGWYGVAVIGAVWRLRYLIPSLKSGADISAPSGVVTPRSQSPSQNDISPNDTR